jgi:membrane protein implicated in regulation of membrane protease activity
MDDETPVSKSKLEKPGESVDQPSSDAVKKQRAAIIGVSIGAVLLLALIILSVIYLLNPGTDTARFRDVFIIFMALESIIIGLVLIILVVQIARLINLLQNEIKPILDSTNETVSTLRGTTQFLSDNIAEPIIKLNEYFAGLQSFIKLIRPAGRKNDPSTK